jgi:hypothetical protein
MLCQNEGGGGFSGAHAECIADKGCETDRIEQLTIGGRILNPFKGTQAFFTHLTPAPTAFYHSLASSLEPASNGGNSKLVEFFFLCG